jgi:predicted transcriptional regulator
LPAKEIIMLSEKTFRQLIDYLSTDGSIVIRRTGSSFYYVSAIKDHEVIFGSTDTSISKALKTVVAKVLS